MPFDTERCGLCDKLYNKKRRCSLKNSQNLFDFIADLFYSLLQKRLSDDIVICTACYTRHSKNLKSANDSHMAFHGTEEPMDYENAVDISNREEKFDASTQTEITDLRDVSIGCILITKNHFSVPITMPSYSNKYCLICNVKFSTQRTITLTNDVRMNTFKLHLIYLHSDSRCCRKHLENNCLESSAIDTLNAIILRRQVQ